MHLVIDLEKEPTFWMEGSTHGLKQFLHTMFNKLNNLVEAYAKQTSASMGAPLLKGNPILVLQVFACA